MTERNESPSKKRSVWPLVVGLPLIAVVAAIAIFLAGGDEESAGQSDSGQSSSEGGGAMNVGEPSGEDPESGASGDESEGSSEVAGIGHPTLGDEDAPVVMLEFSDYQ